jgi:hypothetical protein
MNATGEITHEFREFERRTCVFHSIINITVQFVATSPIQLQIKHINTMKTSASVQNKPIIPSLFHIASRIEDFAPTIISKSAPPLNETPFADLMLHPEKLEAALKTAKMENDAFDSARTFSKSPVKWAIRNATSKDRDDSSARNLSGHSLVELKTTEFQLEAPFAESVKLAADFTDWELFPLDMIKSEDGVWYATVPLPPGNYSYRFIVDGEWCDVPSSVLRLYDNPFGGASAVMVVA